MTKEYLQNVIGLDDEWLTPANHRYARVVARWLEVLAGYVGRLNPTVITFGTVLE